MGQGAGLICSVLMLSLLTGCAAGDLMLKRQSETEARVEQLVQAGKRAETRLTELTTRIQAREEQQKELLAEMKQFRESLGELRSSRDELSARLTLLSQKIATPKIEVVNQDPAPKSREPGPNAGYLKAFGLYTANRFTEAIAAFEAFLKDDPRSEYAANAVYWIGECHYTLAAFTLAGEMFSRVAEEYPASSKAPDALLKLGYTLAAQKEKDKARGVFERLIKSHPGSPAAAKARERLTAH